MVLLQSTQSSPVPLPYATCVLRPPVDISKPFQHQGKLTTVLMTPGARAWIG